MTDNILAEISDQKPKFEEIQSPIFLTKDGWYFWDEIWVDAYGPFKTIMELAKEFEKYSDFLDNPDKYVPDVI